MAPKLKDPLGGRLLLGDKGREKQCRMVRFCMSQSRGSRRVPRQHLAQPAPDASVLSECSHSQLFTVNEAVRDNPGTH